MVIGVTSEEAMATWIKLNDADGAQIYVNVEVAKTVQRGGGYTRISFIGNTEGLLVKETPEHIITESK
jgi:hypothetical protein